MKQSFTPHNKFIQSARQEKRLRKMISAMPLKHKIGQLIFPGVKGDYLSLHSDEMKYYLHLIKDWGIGGFVLFTGTVYDYAHMISELQQRSKLPLLFSADFERGLWMRIPNATPFPHQMGIAATGDFKLAEKIAFVIGTESKALGIYQNYSPVADLFTNPDNPIVNIRAFSEDPVTAGKFCAAFIRGYRKSGILSCAKHFPGHGNTAEDSHKELPVVRGDLQLLMKRELKPFIDSIKAGVDGIMPAHLAVPALEADLSLPASLSPGIIREFLRKKLKFNGLISSDAMAMQAITDNFPVGEAAVRAVEAGNEQLLMSPNPDIALQSIFQAVKEGRIMQGLIDDAVLRMLAAKESLGWDKMRRIKFDEIKKVIFHPAHKEISEQASYKSFKIEGLQPDKFPVSAKQKGILVTIIDAPSVTNENIFKDEFTRRFSYKQELLIESSTPKNLSAVLKKCSGAETIVVAVFVRVRAFRGYVHLPEPIMDFLKNLNDTKANIRFISFGSPLVFSKMKVKHPLMYCYSDSPVSQELAVKVLLSGKKSSEN